jgi:hypothetical protein
MYCSTLLYPDMDDRGKWVFFARTDMCTSTSR